MLLFILNNRTDTNIATYSLEQRPNHLNFFGFIPFFLLKLLKMSLCLFHGYNNEKIQKQQKALLIAKEIKSFYMYWNIYISS